MQIDVVQGLEIEAHILLATVGRQAAHGLRLAAEQGRTVLHLDIDVHTFSEGIPIDVHGSSAIRLHRLGQLEADVALAGNVHHGHHRIDVVDEVAERIGQLLPDGRAPAEELAGQFGGDDHVSGVVVDALGVAFHHGEGEEAEEGAVHVSFRCRHLLSVLCLVGVPVAVLDGRRVLHLRELLPEGGGKRARQAGRLLDFSARLATKLRHTVDAVAVAEAVVVRQFVHHPQVDEEGSRQAQHKAHQVDGGEQQTPADEPKRYFDVMSQHNSVFIQVLQIYGFSRSRQGSALSGRRLCLPKVPPFPA